MLNQTGVKVALSAAHRNVCSDGTVAENFDDAPMRIQPSIPMSLPIRMLLRQAIPAYVWKCAAHSLRRIPISVRIDGPVCGSNLSARRGRYSNQIHYHSVMRDIARLYWFIIG